jgi:hypothetical protein
MHSALIIISVNKHVMTQFVRIVQDAICASRILKSTHFQKFKSVVIVAHKAGHEGSPKSPKIREMTNPSCSCFVAHNIAPARNFENVKTWGHVSWGHVSCRPVLTAAHTGTIRCEKTSINVKRQTSNVA